VQKSNVTEILLVAAALILASSLKFQYFLFSLTVVASCLSLLPRLLVPYTFSTVICFRRRFVRMMLPILLALLRLIVFRMFFLFRLCVILFFRTIRSTDILRPSPAPHLKTPKLLVIFIPWCPKY